MKKYHLVACGGTFDHLHRGHKDFLNFVLELADKAIIGLTSDLYVQVFKKGQGIESFEVRKKELLNYIDSIGKTGNTEIVSIDDHFGPAVTQKYNFDCLTVTDATDKNVMLLNKMRRESGLKTLPVEVFRHTVAQDGKTITSTRIRKGEIDRDGKPYIKKEWLNRNLVLPEKLRPELQKIWGQLVDIKDVQIDAQKTITVGDVTTKNFLDKNIVPILAIVDFKVERKPINHTEFKNVEIINSINPPGVISSELLNAVRNSFEDLSEKVIIVDGEEDLAVLPAIIYAPLGFEVFYGQPGQGLVKVDVSEENKEKTYKLINKFKAI